jgi:hypothetical protein
MDGIMAVQSKSTFGKTVLLNPLRILACGLLAAIAASTASAESICVLCSGPEAAYECNAYANEPIPDAALSLFCTSRIADDYGHKRCAVEKNNKNCMGLPVHFPYNSDTSANFGFTFDSAQQDADKEPETLGELANETYDASKQTVKKTGEAIEGVTEKTGKAIENAGESIGNATKNTLKCIQSALSDC